MDSTGYLGFLFLASAVVGISGLLDRLYAAILPARFLYYALRMPGIVLHELAHVAGCLCTGAKIRNVVLFSKEGGSVTYANPKIPVIGTVIISTAPLLLLPLVLSFLTWVFSACLGCDLPITLPEPHTGILGYGILETVSGLFVANLITEFNGWFLLYLYLCVTIILSLAPSRQDFVNAAAGILLVAGSGLLVILSGYGPAISCLSQVLDLMAYPFLLGLVFEIIAGVVAVPLSVLYGIRSH
ncbi:MAG TPA: M50 family metallopeptidase [Methanoregulaceae archaeon]|nr:M50 family metallopeptidase [Methanoregulaceae archaeon]HPD75239.1 M50 family metallopeptidase [Methanoregulaceae archaeon]HRY75110.1 M50 family metallopeptidase [Methanoregulaceae archaeon]